MKLNASGNLEWRGGLTNVDWLRSKGFVSDLEFLKVSLARLNDGIKWREAVQYSRSFINYVQV